MGSVANIWRGLDWWVAAYDLTRTCRGKRSRRSKEIVLQPEHTSALDDALCTERDIAVRRFADIGSFVIRRAVPRPARSTSS